MRKKKGRSPKLFILMRHATMETEKLKKMVKITFTGNKKKEVHQLQPNQRGGEKKLGTTQLKNRLVLHSSNEKERDCENHSGFHTCNELRETTQLKRNSKGEVTGKCWAKSELQLSRKNSGWVVVRKSSPRSLLELVAEGLGGHGGSGERHHVSINRSIRVFSRKNEWVGEGSVSRVKRRRRTEFDNRKRSSWERRRVDRRIKWGNN